MPGRTIVITGASDGIGAAAARALARTGEHVVVVGRDPQKTAAIGRELAVPYHVADFADLSQVQQLAATLLETQQHIDVLVNNAGGIMGERRLTVDGLERTFQVNHLAGHLLTRLLLPRLSESRASVIQTASKAARFFADFDLTDLQHERHYAPERAYGNGKLANILFTRELHRRYGTAGIAAVAFHPGVVASNFASDTTHPMRWAYHTPLVRRTFTITPARSAQRLLWLVNGRPGETWQPGEYYEGRRIARSHPAAADPAVATRLWDASERLLTERGLI